MRPNLRLSAEATDLPKRCLTNAGRAVETQYRRFEVAFELYDGQVFYNAILDIVETEMIGVEMLTSVLEVEIILVVLCHGRSSNSCR